MHYYLIGIFLVIVIQLIFYHPLKKWHIRRAGIRGEKSTYFGVRRLVKRNKGILLRNIRLPLYETETEIDMLIVSSRGIICVENKHVSGRISGELTDQYWQQHKSHFEKKQLYNPIKQNEGHIKCLNHHLIKNGQKNTPIFSYIVFSNKNALLKIKDSRMGTISQFRKYLKKTYFKMPHKINTQEVIKIINKIKL